MIAISASSTENNNPVPRPFDERLAEYVTALVIGNLIATLALIAYTNFEPELIAWAGSWTTQQHPVVAARTHVAAASAAACATRSEACATVQRRGNP